MTFHITPHKLPTLEPLQALREIIHILFLQPSSYSYVRLSSLGTMENFFLINCHTSEHRIKVETKCKTLLIIRQLAFILVKDK